MFITKKHISRRTVLKAAGVSAGVAVSGCHGARRHGSGPNRRGAQAADGLLLHSSRRDHGQHVAWSGHGQVDAQRLRRRFQAQPDSRLARAVQEVRFVFRQSGERRHGGLGSYVHSRHVAQRHPSGHRRSPRAHGHDARSGDRESHQPGHAAALARSRLGNHRSVGGGRRRLLYHSVFPRRGIAAADGIQSAEGLSAVVRRRRHAAGARIDQPPDQQHSRSDPGRHQEAPGRPRKQRPRRSRRVSRKRSRDRAAHAEGGGKRSFRASRFPMLPSGNWTTSPNR